MNGTVADIYVTVLYILYSAVGWATGRASIQSVKKFARYNSSKKITFRVPFQGCICCMSTEVSGQIYFSSWLNKAQIPLY